jgi:hypothetical protein
MAHDTFEMEMPVRRLEGIPNPVKTAIAALLGVGGLALVGAFLTDPTRAWRAYLFNWLFWASLAQGGVMLAAAVTMTRGVWARPVRRIALSFVAFVPISFLLLLPLLFFGGESIFPWYGHDLHGKEAYLNMPFLTVRNIVLMGALTVLSLSYAYWAIRPDAGLLRDKVPERLRGLYGRLTQGWSGQEAEEAKATKRLAVLGPILGLTWAVAFSVVAWDFVMSLEEHWYSTLIGPYYFMAGFLGAIALTAVLTSTYRSKLGLEGVIEGPQFHDLGKLTFAFAIFWTYLLWSQYIVIWYGMLPWEQTFLVHRMQAPFAVLFAAVFIFLFVLPFALLLGIAPKRSPKMLSTVAAIVLVGLWLERYVLVYPSYYHGAESLPLGWQEIGMALPFAGLFLLALMAFATRFPIIQLWQPLADEALLGSTEEPPGTAAVTAE